MPKLTILQRDIIGAKRDDERHCPIARAFVRLHPGNEISVFDGSVMINGHHLEHTEESRAFALEWNDGPVDPVTIQFPSFAHALRKSAIRNRQS